MLAKIGVDRAENGRRTGLKNRRRGLETNTDIVAGDVEAVELPEHGRELVHVSPDRARNKISGSK